MIQNPPNDTYFRLVTSSVVLGGVYSMYRSCSPGLSLGSLKGRGGVTGLLSCRDRNERPGRQVVLRRVYASSDDSIPVLKISSDASAESQCLCVS